MLKYFLHSLMIILLTTGYSTGQNKARKKYIEQYKDLAIREMQRTGIPASITLAQGILESGNGKSRLARVAKNHFGIKCHDWDGPYIRVDDDRKGEKFRKYRSVEESYIDHSEFLSRRGRYSFLFELDITDYKGWARGLKKAGYATAPHYHKMLIKIIESEKLYRFDKLYTGKKRGNANSGMYDLASRIFTINRRECIKIKAGDTFYAISKTFDMPIRRIKRYNDLDKHAILQTDEIIYIEKKRARPSRGNDYHIVKEGETLHDIAQMYGIRLRRVCRYNYIDKDEKLIPGEKIFLRGYAEFK